LLNAGTQLETILTRRESIFGKSYTLRAASVKNRDIGLSTSFKSVDADIADPNFQCN
jgi:hypothetical protein